MHRFYLPRESWQSSTWELSGDEAKHAVKVLRMKEGDSCIVFDGEGQASSATITSIISSELVYLQPGNNYAQTPPAPLVLELYQAIPKGGNMDLIIQKAVELGASRIIPLVTEHTIVRLSAKDAIAKRKKWQRIALEACKQCGQNILPSIETPVGFQQGLVSFGKVPDQLYIIASLAPGALPIRDILEQARSQQIHRAAVLIGPEGDFSPEETAFALQLGFQPVTLGPIVLRVETAAFFCLSALRYALD